MIIIPPAIINDAALTSSNVTEADYAAWSSTTIYAASTRVIVTTPDEHRIYEAVRGTSATVTTTIAAPAVITWTAHGQAAGTKVVWKTTGALPTGFVAGTTYYWLPLTVDTGNLAATVGGTPITTTGSQSGVHTLATNLNQAPSANLTGLTPLWQDIGATNRWKMFDNQNNTQTTNADYIEVQLTPAGLITAFFAGNCDIDSWTYTVTDPVEGVVYTETQSTVISNSGSSFWNWGFRPIQRKTIAVSVTIPPYAGATHKIRFTKTGGTAKVGVCVIGRWTDIGLSQYGLGTDIKDYSTVRFNTDGTSETTERGYSKRMTLDIDLPNTDIDWVQNMLATYKQTNVVWLGVTDTVLESTCIFGRYSSFKNIIQYFSKSKMALQIEGAV